MRKEERKRKEAQIRRLKKKAELGSLETAKRLGIPEACKYSQERIKTAQKKKPKKEHKKTEDGHVLLKYQMTQQEKEEQKLERLLIAQVGGTLGNQNEEV